MTPAELAALAATSRLAGNTPPPLTRDEARRVLGWGLIQTDLNQSATCAR